MIKEIQRVWTAARSRLPEMQLFITMTNFSLALPPIKEQMHLEHFNSFIQKNMNFIPLLALAQFMVKIDHIHWKLATARATLQHWAQQLNILGPTTQ